MTAYNPRTRSFFRRAWLVGVVALFALAGCKTKDGNGSGATTKPRDPLVYGPTRIPPQNVPVSERGGVGSAGPKIDPLKDRSVGSSGDKTGVGYADGPERFRGTHVPGPATTPAALAAKANDSEELKIDTPDFRVPLRQVGGTLPVGGGTASPPPEGLDQLYAELAKYGVTPSARSLTQENGEYTFRAAVPISDNGAKRQYAGVGRTAAEAVKQVLDQLQSDGK